MNFLRKTLFIISFSPFLGISQSNHQLIDDFLEALEGDINEFTLHSNIPQEAARIRLELNEELSWIQETYDFQTDLSLINPKKNRKKLVNILTNTKKPSFITTWTLKELVNTKEYYEKIVVQNDKFKQLYIEMSNQFDKLDKSLIYKIDSLNAFHSSYINHIQNQITVWEVELSSIKKDLKIDTSAFLNFFSFSKSEEFELFHNNYRQLLREVGQYIGQQDLPYMLEIHDDLNRKKEILKAEKIRADLENGDGICIAKITDSKWGVFQVWGKNVKTLIIPAYDSIGQLGWNDPFIKVWNNGKVGLHGMNFSDKPDSLLISCAYDELLIGQITDNKQQFIGYYCAVRVANKWGFLNWNNGQIIEPINMEDYQHIDSYENIARKQEW